MKKIISFFMAFALLITLLPGQQTEAAGKFKDVSSNHWAVNQIEALSSKGIISGYKDGTFKPNANITKGQAAIMLARALHLRLGTYPNPGYADIGTQQAAYQSIAALSYHGIFGKASRFYPETKLTREEMSRLIATSYNLKGDGKANFPDVKTTYPTFNVIDSITDNGIAQGYPDGNFKPKELITRAQFSVFMMNTTKFSIPKYESPVVIKGVFKQNPKYDYVYMSNGELIYWYYLGDTKNAQNIWGIFDQNDNFFKILAYQNQNGTHWASLDTEIFASIPSPLMLDMRFGEELDRPQRVTSIDKTITVWGTTYKNVIEIKDSKGIYEYYAPNIGLILVVDKSVKPENVLMQLYDRHAGVQNN